MENFMQFVQTTVQAVEEICPFPLSVSDETGYIIADSNPARVGTHHQPSSNVLKQNAPQQFHENGLVGVENVFPGVALPLHFDSKTHGVLGIIGEPEEVLPHAKLIKCHVEVVWQDITHYCELLHIDPTLERYCILIDIGDVLLKHTHGTEQLNEAARFRKTLLKKVRYCFSGNT